MTKFVCVVLIAFLSLGALSAQKNVTHQEIYWLRYNNDIRFKKNERLSWQNEIEMRRFFERSVLHQIIMHTRLHYVTTKNTNVAISIAYSRQSPNDPNSTSNLVIPEYRWASEFNYRIPVTNRFTLHQRLRIDNRFVQKNDGQELLDGFNFSLRFRFRLQANYRISNDAAPKRTTAKISNELMVNAGSSITYNYFDQNRLYLGIEQDLSRNFSAEIGYMKLYQQTSAGNRFFDRDIVRFTIYQRIKM